MRIPLRVRLGFSIAIVSLLTVSISLGLRCSGVYRSHLLLVLLGMGLVGLALVVAHCIRDFSDSKPAETSSSTRDPGSDHPLAFLANCGYWGQLLLLSVFPVYFLNQALPSNPSPVPVAARKIPPPAPTNPPPTVVESPKPVDCLPVEFPELRLQGFNLNGSHSTMVLNGRTLAAGQNIGGVKVVSIEPWGAVVEFQGKKKAIDFNLQVSGLRSSL